MKNYYLFLSLKYSKKNSLAWLSFLASVRQGFASCIVPIVEPAQILSKHPNVYNNTIWILKDILVRKIRRIWMVKCHSQNGCLNFKLTSKVLVPTSLSLISTPVVIFLITIWSFCVQGTDIILVCLYNLLEIECKIFRKKSTINLKLRILQSFQ